MLEFGGLVGGWEMKMIFYNLTQSSTIFHNQTFLRVSDNMVDPAECHHSLLFLLSNPKDFSCIRTLIPLFSRKSAD